MMSGAKINKWSYISSNTNAVSLFGTGDIMSENSSSKQSISRKPKFNLKVSKELATTLVANGSSPIDIANEFGYSPATVYNYLKGWNIDWSMNIKRALKDMCPKDTLYTLLNIDGLSQEQIANKYDVTSQVVCRLIRKYKIQLDPTIKYVNSIDSRLARQKTFSAAQHSVVIGSILGDGHLRVPAEGGVNASLQFGHCVKQRPYLEWKLDLLNDFWFGDIYEHHAQNACRAATICHPEFTKLYQLFYIDAVKVIPENIDDLLNPLAMAIWYMDDGYTTKYSSVFHTNSFSSIDHERLLNTSILSMLGARSSKISSNGKRYPTIVFYGDEHRALHQLIDPLMLDLFNYKKLSGSSETTREAPL